MIRTFVCVLELMMIFSLLVGCNSRTADITTPTDGAPRKTSTPTASGHTMDQQTRPEPISTPEQTAAAVPIDTEVQKSKDLLFAPCLPINDRVPVEKNIPQDLFVIRGNQPSILDLNANRETDLTPLGRQGAWDYFVSPDGKWVAYQSYQGSQRFLTVLPIFSLRKNLVEPGYQWSAQDSFYLEGWFSKETLLLKRQSTGKAFPIAEISTVILNPFTQEEHEFNLEDYPNYKKYLSGGLRSTLFGESNLLPDPSLSLVVYPEVAEGMYYITLWDRTKRQAIVKMEFFYEDMTNNPLWSPDGKDFLIKNPGLAPEDGIEWFQVTREGRIRQLTHFGRFTAKSPYYPKSSRSWDGRYLAFHLEYQINQPSEKMHAKYFVLDVESPKLQGFCIDATSFTGGELFGPVWSADNRYVALSNSSYGIGNVILVDVVERQAYLLGEDIRARGWITRP